MKLTKQKLNKLIAEELRTLSEMDNPSTKALKMVADMSISEMQMALDALSIAQKKRLKMIFSNLQIGADFGIAPTVYSSEE